MAAKLDIIVQKFKLNKKNLNIKTKIKLNWVVYNGCQNFTRNFFQVFKSGSFLIKY